MLNHSPETKQL